MNKLNILLTVFLTVSWILSMTLFILGLVFAVTTTGRWEWLILVISGWIFYAISFLIKSKIKKIENENPVD